MSGVESPVPDYAETADASPAEPTPRRKPVFGVQMLLRLALLIALLVVWALAVRIFEIPPLLLPDPSRVLQSLFADLTSWRLLSHAWVTLKEVLGGFFAGAGAGFLLGCFLGRFASLQRFVYPYIVAFETIPKVAIAPLIVVWFGFGIDSKIVTSALICFFPVVANTLVGLRTASPDLIEMMTAFSATRGQIFWKMQLPNALPYVFAGLEIGIVMSVIGAIVGEFVGSQSGLGFMILQRQFSMDIAGVFSILIILSVFGIVLNQIIRFLQRRIVFWIDDIHHPTGG